MFNAGGGTIRRQTGLRHLSLFFRTFANAPKELYIFSSCADSMPSLGAVWFVQTHRRRQIRSGYLRCVFHHTTNFLCEGHAQSSDPAVEIFMATCGSHRNHLYHVQDPLTASERDKHQLHVPFLFFSYTDQQMHNYLTDFHTRTCFDKWAV